MKHHKYSEKTEKFLHKHISRHIEKYHMPPKQAVAAAFNEAREKGLLTGKKAYGKYEEYRKKKNDVGFGLFR